MKIKPGPFKRLFLIFLMSIWAACAYAAEGHCSSDEQVFFSCVISKSPKVVSICASPKLTKRKGVLVYRFGALGKLEFEFSSQAGDLENKFKLWRYWRYQTERTELSFNNGKFTYTVFDYYDGQEKLPYRRGIRVSPKNGKGKEVELQCSGNVVSSLEKLEGIIQTHRGP